MATIKRVRKPFHQVKVGEVFLKKENEAFPEPYLKIEACRRENSNINAARMSDGKVFFFTDTETTYSMTEYTFY